MRDFVIATDSDTEIPLYFADKYDMPVFLMPYTVNGQERLFDLGRDTDIIGFYKELASGADAITSTRPPADIVAFFEEIIKKGKDILYLSFSSALSGHYELVLMARNEVLEKYTDARIEVVDTLRISMGAGVLVMAAQRLLDQGKSMDEIIEWVEDNRHRAHAWFSVDDLNYLKKGGRLSGAAAAIGTMLGVKPILKINHEGKIVPADKVKGSKMVLKFFLGTVMENVQNPKEQTAYVLHANNIEAAGSLKTLIEQNVGFKEICIQDVGPVIGCHTGPGVLGVIFMGKPITS
ncbi:MAG: DegV family protein [Christensenellales bacterium]